MLVSVSTHLVTVRLLYWRPDYTHLLQTFVWQTEDRLPELPKVDSFFRHWYTKIRVPINDATICVGRRRVDYDWRRAEWAF